MDTNAVAEALGMTYQKALALMKLPGFPAVRMGRRLHTTRELLNRWVERHGSESHSYRLKVEKHMRKPNRRTDRIAFVIPSYEELRREMGC